MDRTRRRLSPVHLLAWLAACAACAACGILVLFKGQAAVTVLASPVRAPNIAQEVLDIEGLALPTPQSMRQVLDATISDAARRVQDAATALAGLAPRERALRSLQIMAAALRDHHFVYPGRGGVPTLHDGLATVNVDRSGLEWLLAAPENAQAVQLIRSNPQGGFHIADCDIFSLLYVGIGEVLGLPIAMVELPATPEGSAHAYVRWTMADGAHLDWEAASGTERDAAVLDARFFAQGPMTMAQARQQRAFAVAMSREETLGHAHLLLGALWQGLGADDKALLAYRRAADKRPGSPVAHNEIAWLLATSSDPGVRHPRQAVAAARKLVGLWPSASHLDTLAAAYAADGQFESAVRTQVRAIESASPLDPRLADFRLRCAAYLRNEAYIQPRREELQKQLHRDALMDPAWRDLALTAEHQPVAGEGQALQQECAHPRG
jgi:tetratricopeptide (TPR) repeat protein